MKYSGLICIISSVLVGCAAPTHRLEYKITPTKIENQIKFIDTKLEPVCTIYGCESFFLNITNKSDKTIEVNWNKTLFISNNQSSGGFMFDGVVYRDRNSPKSPDVVFPNGSMKKIIYPNNLVSFSSGGYGGWKHEKFPNSEVGAYLTVTMDGKDYSQKMTTYISLERIPLNNLTVEDR